MSSVGEEIVKAVRQKGQKYVRTKSEKGGIQDQMNCVYAFMEGYMSESDESDSISSIVCDDKKLCVTPAKARRKAQTYQYLTGKAQWQISAIEMHSKLWKLSLVQIFQLGEFLYCYCPQFTGSPEDYTRLKLIGKRTANSGKGPMAALNLAKIEHANDLIEQARKYLEEAGQTLEVTIK